MTINPEIFWSVLAALFVYGLGKHLVAVALSQFGRRPSENHAEGRSKLG